jgi:hypothetical protein
LACLVQRLGRALLWGEHGARIHETSPGARGALQAVALCRLVEYAPVEGGSVRNDERATEQCTDVRSDLSECGRAEHLSLTDAMHHVRLR